MTAILFFYFFIFSKKKKRTSIALFRFDLELSCCQKTLSPLHEAKTQKQKTRKSNLSDLLLLGIDVPLHTRNQPALHKSANENQIKNTLIIFFFLMKKKKNNNRRRFTWRRWWETLESWPWVLSHWRRQRSIEVC